MISRSWTQANQLSGLMINRKCIIDIATAGRQRSGRRGGCKFPNPGICGGGNNGGSPGAPMLAPCRGASRRSPSTSTRRRIRASGSRSSRPPSADAAPAGAGGGGARSGAGGRAVPRGGQLLRRPARPRRRGLRRGRGSLLQIRELGSGASLQGRTGSLVPHPHPRPR